MSHLGSERARRGALIILPLAGLLMANPAGAQKAASAPAPAAPARIVSHEVTISRTAAMLKLELSDGRTLQLGIQDGEAQLQGLGVNPAIHINKRWWGALRTDGPVVILEAGGRAALRP